MTRINTGIRAFELTDQLLMAECREILRVPNMAFKWLKRHPICDHSSLPKVFSLNTGHVRFFYNKLFKLFALNLTLKRTKEKLLCIW